MGNIENDYHILGVSNHATFNEIREAYRKKVKEFHPDKENGNVEQLNRVKQAYETLRNRETRNRNDDFIFKKSTGFQGKNTPKTNPTVTVVSIRKNNRKRISLLSVTIDVSLMMIGILRDRYLKK